MAKIVLISCVSKKQKTPARAEELYISPFFKYNLSYAKMLKPKRIFILSAKYGLLKLNEVIEPYNMTLKKMKDKEIKDWSEKVIKELKKETSIEEDEFVITAGEKYRKHLLPLIKNYTLPLKGLGIGKQLKFLKEATTYKI